MCNSGSKSFRNLSVLAKVFLLVATADCAVNIALSVTQLIVGQSNTEGLTTAQDEGHNYRGTPNYVYWSSLEIYMVIFFCYYAWDGVLTENMFELHAFQIARLLTSVYVIINYVTSKGKIGTSQIVQFAEILVLQIFYFIFAWLLHRSFGWWVFRKLGADVDLKAMYRNYQIFIAQYKFDLSFGLVLVIMSAFFFSDGGLIAVEVVMFIISIAHAIAGVKGVRAESKKLMYLFFFLSIIEPINIVAKAIAIGLDSKDFGHPPYAQMGVTAGLALVNRVTLIINAWRAYKNFGRGLKENAFDPKPGALEYDEKVGGLVKGKEVLGDEDAVDLNRQPGFSPLYNPPLGANAEKELFGL